MTEGEILIRPMRPEDVPAICALEQSTFSDPWPESSFREILTVPTRINLVLVDARQQLIGYASAQCVAVELQVHNIAVAPDHRRRGHGATLLRAVEALGRERGAVGAILDVRVTNEAARALYERFGYRQVGRRRNYYRAPVCDALMLFRPLGQQESHNRATENGNGMVS